MFRKILCATDFSPGADHALRVAVRLANDANAELVVAHAWHVPAIAFSGETPYVPALLEEIATDSEKELAKVKQRALDLGAKRLSTQFGSGIPWDRVCSFAKDDPEIDLIVMGTHGRTGIRRMLLGSVAEKVIRHAPCSVLAVRGGRDGTKMFQHVLCPVDFSDSAHYAVELAGQLAAADGLGITLFHAFDVPVRFSAELPPDVIETVDRRTAALLEKLATELRGKVTVPVTVRTRIGTPGSQAIHVLEHEVTYDLAVVGSHGRTGVSRALLGSVAEKIVRHAPCPVLVARRRDS
ncbi:MAG: universal stress protein [Myxococcales bacterium]|nr:universal stress protein [Myxococcales bacterium]